MIELQDVNIRYGAGKSAVTAAKNISLKIAQGETWASWGIRVRKIDSSSRHSGVKQ